MYTRGEQARDGLLLMAAGAALLARVGWWAFKWLAAFTFGAIAVALLVVFIGTVASQ